DPSSASPPAAGFCSPVVTSAPAYPGRPRSPRKCQVAETRGRRPQRAVPSSQLKEVSSSAPPWTQAAPARRRNALRRGLLIYTALLRIDLSATRRPPAP